MSSDTMRTLMALLERGTEVEMPDERPVARSNAEFSYDGKGNEITKVIATLRSYDSGKYTKLAQNLILIDRYSAEVERLKDENKSMVRDAIADLFKASDAVLTRVVKTVSFIFTLTRDPKPSDTYKYAKILEELEVDLTPDLANKLKLLKEKYHSTVQKSPSLSVTGNPDLGMPKPRRESIELGEDIWDQLKGWAAKFVVAITRWGQSYDHKLDGLMAQAGVHESIQESIINENQVVTPDHIAMMVFQYMSRDMNATQDGLEIVGAGPKGNTINVSTVDGQHFAISVTHVA